MQKIADIFQTEIYGTDAYRSMHKARMTFPILIDVEPTNACNLNCIFCARQTMTRSLEYMPFEMFRIIIDEMKAYKPTSIRFSGWGEPTLNPSIIDFISYARENRILTHLTTNATLLTPELSESLLKVGLNKIKFSLQGLTESEYLRMRPMRSGDRSVSVYNRVIKNIESFIEIRNNLSASCHIQVSISMLKREQDDQDLQETFYDRWYPKVDSIWGLGKVGVYGGNPLLTTFQRVKATGRISDEDLSQGRPLRKDDLHQGKKCTELYNKISIAADGTMKACCDDYDNKLAIGMVGIDTIKSAWDGKRLKMLIQSIESAECGKAPKFCQECDNYL